MARIRTIKPEFFTSEDICELTPLTRLFYISLWCEADREGRLIWKEKTLKYRYFPAESMSEFNKACSELIDSDLINLYQVDGKEYCEIPSFKTHQVINNRETESKIPSENKEIDASGTRESGVQGEGKGREGKGKEGKGEETSQDEKASSRRNPITPYQKIFDLYKKHLNGNPDLNLVEVMVINDERKAKMKTLWRLVNYKLDKIDGYFEWIYENRNDHKWLFGINSKSWVADIEYLCREKTFTKALEGRLSDFGSSAA